MYNVIKGVLGRKNFDLADITKKINSMWVQGVLSDTQKEELLTMAQGNASTKASVDMVAKMAELEKRIIALENAQATDTEASDSTEETTEETYEEFVVGKWYYAGDKVSFGGKKYECIAPDGVVCVWSPTDYPAYWREITE